MLSTSEYSESIRDITFKSAMMILLERSWFLMSKQGNVEMLEFRTYKDLHDEGFTCLLLQTQTQHTTVVTTRRRRRGMLGIRM